MTRRIQREPLRWPNKPHTAPSQRRRARFGNHTLAAAVDKLVAETENVRRAKNIHVTVDDGDVACAIWFDLPDNRGVYVTRCLAMDAYDKLEHNVWALAMHVNTMRAQERWGVGTVHEAWAGYATLPPSSNAATPTSPSPSPSPWTTAPSSFPPPTVDPLAAAGGWRFVLGFGFAEKPSKIDIDKAFIHLATKVHPDKGGTSEQMTVLLHAREAAYTAVRGPQ